MHNPAWAVVSGHRDGAAGRIDRLKLAVGDEIGQGDQALGALAEDRQCVEGLRTQAFGQFARRYGFREKPPRIRFRVLDARLRVHGIAGLRVIDCSSMPTLVSGNTNAPAVMMAEKAVDMIREDARRR